MATVRHSLQCEVCGTVTLLRTQLGWLYQHPIRIHCGTCNIRITGTAHLNPHEGTWRFVFDNAKVIDEVKPGFYLESSGELLTEKLQPYEGEDTSPISLAPFFTSAFGPMGDRFGEFKRRTVSFLAKKPNWPKVRRINELWRDGNHEYLAQEVHRYLPRESFPMNNVLEYARGVHHVNVMCFIDLVDPTRWQKFIGDRIVEIHEKSHAALEALATEFGDSGLLDQYDAKILDRLDQFIDVFQYLIPVFGLEFYKNIPADLAEKKGITTASFEDLKGFFIDSYESMVEMMRLILAFNNLYYRNDHTAMVNRRKDVKTLAEWDGLKQKGKKIEFLDGTETFDTLIGAHLNHELRNAIGHNSYRYNGSTQVISYFSDGRLDSDKGKDMFFLDFVRSCWGMFASLMALSELVYHTRRVLYLAKGVAPSYPQAMLRPPMNRAQRRAAARKRK